MKFYKVLETAVKAKMLTFVLQTEKRLEVSFWTFFKHLCNQGESEKNEKTKSFC